MSTFHHCNQAKELEIEFEEIEKNETRTLWVVLLTAAMMVVEIAAGYMTGSMALLADGYHMFSHAGALSISFLVYRLAKSGTLKKKLTFGTGKLLPLGGYTSALGLAAIAFWMAYESAQRFFNPVAIEFNEAILVAIVGLLVNLASFALLGSHGHDHHGHNHDEHHHHDDHDHHDHHHPHVHDHNHQSAVLHVLADALTSAAAIVALLAGKYFGLIWLDPVIGIAGSLVILKWAYSLCTVTAKELLDYHPQEISADAVHEKLKVEGIKLIDLHAWRSGPSNIICQIIVETKTSKDTEFYKNVLGSSVKGLHLVVEQRSVSF